MLFLQNLNNFHLVPVIQRLAGDVGGNFVSTGDELRPFQLLVPTCTTVTA